MSGIEGYRYGRRPVRQSTEEHRTGRSDMPGVMDEVEELLRKGQGGQAARRSFEMALSTYLARFGREMHPYQTYREFISSMLSPYSQSGDQLLVADRETALRYIGLLSWTQGSGRDEFEALKSIAELYFRFFEPYVFGGEEVEDMEQLRTLAKAASSLSGKGD